MSHHVHGVISVQIYWIGFDYLRAGWCIEHLPAGANKLQLVADFIEEKDEVLEPHFTWCHLLPHLAHHLVASCSPGVQCCRASAPKKLWRWWPWPVKLDANNSALIFAAQSEECHSECIGDLTHQGPSQSKSGGVGVACEECTNARHKICEAIHSYAVEDAYIQFAGLVRTWRGLQFFSSIVFLRF